MTLLSDWMHWFVTRRLCMLLQNTGNTRFLPDNFLGQLTYEV